MSTVQIEFNPKFEKPFPRTGSRTFDRVHLEPGLNEVDADEWKQVSNDSFVKTLIESSVIKVSASKAEPEAKTEVKTPAK